MEPGGFRDALRAQRFLLPELLVAAAILAAGFAGILPFSATPFLVVFGVLSLWLRGQGPRAVGLAFRSDWVRTVRSEEHTSELQSQSNLVCRLLLEKKKK